MSYSVYAYFLIWLELSWVNVSYIDFRKNRDGSLSAIYNILGSWKSEIKRSWINITILFDFSEPSWLVLQWYKSFLSLFLGNLMIGYVDNNVGFLDKRFLLVLR
jgi:hypothetical protein